MVASEKVDSITGDTHHPESTMEPPSELTFRSGGALFGAFLTYFLTIGFQNSFGVFQDYYTTSLLSNESQFQISWLGSFALFMFFFPAPLVGILTDRFGPTLPMTIGAVLEVFAIFMTSLCKEYYQFFLAQGLLLGVAMSFVTIPATGICPRYFIRNRGLATGITAAGSSLGGVVWPIVVDQLLKKDGISFPWTMRIVGFIMIPIFAIVVLVTRPPAKQTEKKEFNVEAQHAQSSESIAIMITGGNEGNGNEMDKKKADLSALRSPVFVLLCSGLFFLNLGFSPPLFFATTYASHLRLRSLSFYFSSFINAASLFGRILPGWAADKFGRFNLLILSGCSAGIVAFCWTIATSEAGFIIWSLAFGFCSGAILSLLIATSTSVVPPEIVTTAIGTAMGSVSLANLFASPIGGQLLEHGGYIGVSCYAGAVLFAGTALVVVARSTQSRSLFVKL